MIIFSSIWGHDWNVFKQRASVAGRRVFTLPNTTSYLQSEKSPLWSLRCGQQTIKTKPRRLYSVGSPAAATTVWYCGTAGWVERAVTEVHECSCSSRLTVHSWVFTNVAELVSIREWTFNWTRLYRLMTKILLCSRNLRTSTSRTLTIWHH